MRSAAALGSFVAALALTASPAAAFDRELQLGADVVYAFEQGPGPGPHGVGVGLRGRYGLTDYIAVAGMASWAGHFLEEGPPPLRHVATAAAGVVYAVDVVRVVPYLSLLAGVAVRREERTGAAFLLHVAGGFDFLWNRDLSTGLEVAYELTLGREVLPARLVVAFRVSWHRLP